MAELIDRCWQDGLSVKATMLALRRQGFDPSFEQVREAFSRLSWAWLR